MVNSNEIYFRRNEINDLGSLIGDNNVLFWELGYGYIWTFHLESNSDFLVHF